MASLTGSSIASSYTSLLKLSGNTDNIVAGNGSNAIQVVDGDGTTSPLYLNTDRLGIGGQPTQIFHSKGTNAGASLTLAMLENVTSDANSEARLFFVSGGNLARGSYISSINTSASGQPADLVFATSSAYATPTERMRINSSGNVQVDGNLGIGAVPDVSRKLVVTSTNTTNANAVLYTNAVHTGTGDNSVFSVRSDNNSASGTVVNIHNDGSGACLNINSNGSGPALITDSSVGIGVTPETSHSSVTNLQIGGLSNITSTAAQSAGGSTWLGNNVYINSSGSQAHIVTDEASVYRQVSGTHNFQTVASGSADASISFTTNMILDINSRISLSNNDSGTSNTIFGKNTAISLDAGSNYNTFIGENVADASLDDATYNVGIGHNALTDLTTADSTVAVGALCLENITTGAENTAVGTSAMRNSTTANNNTAIGRQAMGSGVTTGTDNVAVGHNSGLAITSSQYNTLIGKSSGSSITTGWNSVMIGYATGDATVDSHKHTLVGAGACGNADLTTDGAVAVGYTALADLTVGTCVGVGFEAGKDNTTGGNNVFLGYKAGNSGSNDVTDGQANTIIGSEATAGASGAINRTAIGRTTVAVADNSVTLGNATVSAVYMAQDGDAVMYADANINSSDRRLKENISDSDLGLAFVNALRPVSYNLKNKKNSAKLKYGIIAQEVQEVLKESGNEDFAGITDKGEYLGADYVQFIAPLIKAVQELSAKVTELENK